MGMGDIIRDMGDVRPFLCPAWFFAGFFVKTAVLNRGFGRLFAFLGLFGSFLFFAYSVCKQVYGFHT